MGYVHISAKVDRRIEDLRNAGKAGKALAQKATFIIKSLTFGSIRDHMDKASSYTKYGEKRIRNCRKYDLGCGYRLITLQRGETVFIPFLGNHDECQRWLENNSRLKAFNAGKGETIHVEDRKSSPANLRDFDNIDMDADGDGFLQNLTDKVLREVFKGLVEGAERCRDKY